MLAGSDLILVLDKGTLIEHGTHQELLKAQGRYAELYGMQTAAYTSESLLTKARVSAGEPILSPTVTRQLIAHVADTGAAARRQHAVRMLRLLSEREREVAVAVGRGRSNAEISGELFMSIATVKAHISRILDKLAHDAGLTG
ncbi:response regulator transcription factor [Nonomuraea zeae]|nr:LuxR C-terminal-related transcriptional regulator [Nonomuraea zeae]